MERLFLDTNVLIYLLRNKLPKWVEDKIDGADWLGISVIVRLEFLSYRSLSQETEDGFLNFCQNVEQIGMGLHDIQLLDMIIEIRKLFHLKLPDAIIAASAKLCQSILLSADPVFGRLSKDEFLQIESFKPEK